LSGRRAAPRRAAQNNRNKTGAAVKSSDNVRCLDWALDQPIKPDERDMKIYEPSTPRVLPAAAAAAMAALTIAVMVALPANVEAVDAAPAQTASRTPTTAGASCPTSHTTPT
jgi:hypothetical protein